MGSQGQAGARAVGAQTPSAVTPNGTVYHDTMYVIRDEKTGHILGTGSDLADTARQAFMFDQVPVDGAKIAEYRLTGVKSYEISLKETTK